MQASWKAVMEVTKAAITQNDSPLVWGTDAVTCIHEHGMGLPNVELAPILVHCLTITITSNASSASASTVWTYIHHAVSCQMVSALHMLALLTSRILPNRQQQPGMYKMYLELSSTFVFSLSSTKHFPCRDRIVKAVDEALHLSKSPDTPITEVGAVIVHFMFTLVARLAEAVFEDWKSNKGALHGQMMGLGGEQEKLETGLEQLRKNNSLAAVHLMAMIMHNKRTAGLLRIARRNLQEQWTLFVQRLQFLESLTNDPSSTAPKEAMEALGQLATAIEQGLRQEWRPTQMPVIKALLPASARSCSFSNAGGLGCSSVWLPFDIYMEAAMEGRRLSIRSNAEILADVMKAMQSVHAGKWVDVFLGVYTAGLRSVKRDRDSKEGPNTHVESRLCMLLSILPLAVGIVIDEEEKEQLHPENVPGDERDRKLVGGRRAALETCIQLLGQFEALVVPPPVAVPAANQVAAKVAAFGGQNMTADTSSFGKPAVGTMRHLIVDSCVARGLLDKAAYFWLATGGPLTNIPASPSQPSPWSAFMDGAPLSSALRAALTTSPAESVAELEKIYKTAIVGPEEERPAAASILCGATLIRSWTVQEHAVHFAVQLLSPLGAENRSGNNNALLGYAPMLYAALQGMNTMDALNVLSLFGMFPELAASLLPLCEVFGSLSNAKPVATSLEGEPVTAHMLFTMAFLQLIKLWKFHRPPLEHCLLGGGAGLGADLSLEYLLQMRSIPSNSSSFGVQVPGPALSPPASSVVSLDSFPRLQAWYMQHQACISATVSVMVRNGPVHQVADRLLAMMFNKGNKSSSSSSSASALSGNVNGSSEDASGRPVLPAWDIIAAVPIVMEYALTACSHGTLSPRELTTGLRDLVDYLPGCIATIVSYCSAENTRGLWKYASMNGQDWPSPAANLLTIQGEVKEILAAVGVHIPNPTGVGGGNAPVSLPLPLATLIGLTIMYKLDKHGDQILSVAGPGLEKCSGAGPSCSMQVVAALWVQKVKRWHDHIVFLSSCSVFKMNKEAKLQLLRSCFAATLSTSTALGSKLQMSSGVGALLGSWSGAHGPEPVAPGIVYLRSYVLWHDIMFLSDETLRLVAESAREQRDAAGEAGASSRLQCVQGSLSACLARAVQASSLGASLLYVSGGTTLVAKLFTDCIPTWFLSGSGLQGTQSPGGLIVEGYAIAHFALLSGALAWGVSGSSTQPEHTGVPFKMRRHHVLGAHMQFLASGLGGELPFRCEQTVWRSYVVGFLALMVTCTPSWILELKIETLRKLATGLRFWHEPDLAVALLERGGAQAMAAAAELILG